MQDIKDPKSFNIFRIFKMDELISFEDKENINKYKFYKSTKNEYGDYVAEINPTDYNKLNIPIYIRKLSAQ